MFHNGYLWSQARRTHRIAGILTYKGIRSRSFFELLRELIPDPLREPGQRPYRVKSTVMLRSPCLNNMGHSCRRHGSWAGNSASRNLIFTRNRQKHELEDRSFGDYLKLHVLWFIFVPSRILRRRTEQTTTIFTPLSVSTVGLPTQRS